MSKAIWEAIWEWIPGVVAGGLPMMVFIVCDVLAVSNGSQHTDNGNAFAAHMLILAIANSSVSAVTSFSRLVRGRVPNFLRDGRGPVLMIILILVILAYVTALYALLEGGTGGELMYRLALGGLVGSLLTSLYMEFTIARLHELAKARRRRRRSAVVSE